MVVKENPERKKWSYKIKATVARTGQLGPFYGPASHLFLGSILCGGILGTLIIISDGDFCENSLRLKLSARRVCFDFYSSWYNRQHPQSKFPSVTITSMMRHIHNIETPKIKVLVNIVNGWKKFTIFVKSSILDSWLSDEYACGIFQRKYEEIFLLYSAC